MTDTEREAWLRDRQSGIGSSDAAEVIGKGWSGADGPGRVYRSKVEPVDPRPSEGILLRGNELEPLVASYYERDMGVRLDFDPLIRHPDRPWQLASNDRTRLDNGRKVELKTVTSFTDEWGEQGSADVPERYRIQVQHQMGVSQATDIDLYALEMVSWKTRLYRIDFDPEFFAWLTNAEAKFYWGHVTAKIEPGPDWLQAIGPVPTAIDPEVKLDLGDDWAHLLDLRRQQQKVRDDAEEAINQYTAQIRAAMGTAAKAVAGKWKLSRSMVAGKEIKYQREPYERLDIRQAR